MHSVFLNYVKPCVVRGMKISGNPKKFKNEAYPRRTLIMRDQEVDHLPHPTPTDETQEVIELAHHKTAVIDEVSLYNAFSNEFILTKFEMGEATEMYNDRVVDIDTTG